MSSILLFFRCLSFLTFYWEQAQRTARFAQRSYQLPFDPGIQRESIAAAKKMTSPGLGGPIM
jgi:hypothetical protein